MSDEWITFEQVVAQAVAPFVETVGDAAEAATAVLGALREAGFDVYRPEGCPLVDYWQDTPDDKVALVDGDGRRIYGAGIPDGRYRLVPVREDDDG